MKQLTKPIVLDAAYKPAKTPLLIAASASGCSCIQGAEYALSTSTRTISLADKANYVEVAFVLFLAPFTTIMPLTKQQMILVKNRAMAKEVHRKQTQLKEKRQVVNQEEIERKQQLSRTTKNPVINPLFTRKK